jgi:hypothetical protein
MGFFDLIRAPFLQTGAFKDIVARYQRLRPLHLRLNNELVERLSRDVVLDGAKRIGILHGGTIVFDNEDQSSVLMDYCIYNVRRKGRNAIEQYLCDCPPDPDSDEMACLHAMQHATYSLVAVLRVEPGVGCHVRNLFTEETRLLVDMGFSKTAKPGLVMATRLLDFGDYIATGGAVLPMGILASDELERWQQKLRAGVDDDHFDPAELIRACLERGASSHVRYAESGIQGRSNVGGGAVAAETAAERRRVLAKHQAHKTAANRRCRCGSGKLFRNCCGKGENAQWRDTPRKTG